MSAQLAPIEVFYSYADADEDLRSKLDTHLSQLRRDGLITTWHKRQIIAGTDWAKAFDEHFNMASVILLLISADFLASDYCYGVEMQRAMERHDANEARVIPILLRPCDRQSAPFGKLQSLPSDGRPVSNRLNSDEAFANIAQGIRVALQDIQHLAVSAPLTTFPRIWSVPYSRNPVFTGREELLEQLHTQLQTMQAAALSQPQAISGLGGVGKTQLAIEYAYRYRQEYQIVLWVRANAAEALNASYAKIATLLRLPQRNEQKQEVIVQAVKDWLKAQQSWLLILDNADELSIVQPFLPTLFGGHLLLTTRALATVRLARRFEVKTMDAEVGALLLLRRAGLIDPNAALSDASPANRVVALEITRGLGGLPLALDQAGAYIEKTSCGLAGYQRLYQMRQRELLQHRGINDDYPDSVATTWSLSFEKVKQRNPAAADLLRFCAFLAPDAIPEEILTNWAKTYRLIAESTNMGTGPLQKKQGNVPSRKPKRPFFALLFRKRIQQQYVPQVMSQYGTEELGETSAPAASDLNRAIESLQAYSLVSRDAETQTLSVHRLVQAVVRDSMPVDVQHQWMQRAVDVVQAACPRSDFEHWPALEWWLPHALLCATWIEQAAMPTLDTVLLLTVAGSYLQERARYTEAEPLHKRALEICEQLLKEPGEDEEVGELKRLIVNIFTGGAIRLSTVMSLNNLAQIYQEQGKYEQAEPLFRRALDTLKQQPEQHSETDASAIASLEANILNNLATFYGNQGKYTEAESRHRQALDIRERTSGADVPATAESLNNLAALYYAQGKDAEAEPLFLRALAIREEKLGAKHPRTAQSLNNLALLYENQRKYEQAEPLFLRALAINEEAYREPHPDIASDHNNLATLYENQRKYEQAETHYQRSLTIKVHTLGPRHPSTHLTRRNYAALLRAIGRNSEAERLESEDNG